MELPINEKELVIIINSLKGKGDDKLYRKLWCYKMNYLNKKMETTDGLS